MKKSKAAYYTKYTAGSYLDAVASIPIGMAEGLAKVAERTLGEKTPDFLSWEKIKDQSEVYQAREKLREKLDTRPGALFIQSSLISSIPFVLAGIPMAEFAQHGIDRYLSEAPKIAQYAIDSAATLAAQIITGYSTFMVNEVRANKEKYIGENGKLSIKKIGVGFGKAVKAFLSIDVPYALGKLAGQSYFLATGRDPWKASALFDSFAVPVFFAASIALGLANGVIETRETAQWQEDSRKSSSGGLEAQVLNTGSELIK